MNTKEIQNAARNGKTFNINNVKLSKIVEMQSENGTFADVTFVASAHFNNTMLDIHNFNNIQVCEKPKYDPCRPFKKGDIAKPRMVDGRKEFHFQDGDILKVCRDENDYHMVSVENQEGVGILTNALFLELVTPVEELNPFVVIVDEQTGAYQVCERVGHLKDTFNIMATYDPSHPNPKTAAEAECKRLNKECKRLNKECRKNKNKG